MATDVALETSMVGDSSHSLTSRTYDMQGNIVVELYNDHAPKV